MSLFMPKSTSAGVMPGPENMKGFFAHTKGNVGFALKKTKNILFGRWSKATNLEKFGKGFGALWAGFNGAGNAVKALQQAWELKTGKELYTNILNLGVQFTVNAATAVLTLGPFVASALEKFAPTRGLGLAMRILNVGKAAPILPVATVATSTALNVVENHSLGDAEWLDKMTSFGSMNRALRRDDPLGGGVSVFKPYYDWGRKFEKSLGIHRIEKKDPNKEIDQNFYKEVNKAFVKGGLKNSDSGVRYNA